MKRIFSMLKYTLIVMITIYLPNLLRKSIHFHNILDDIEIRSQCRSRNSIWRDGKQLIISHMKLTKYIMQVRQMKVYSIYCSSQNNVQERIDGYCGMLHPIK